MKIADARYPRKEALMFTASRILTMVSILILAMPGAGSASQPQSPTAEIIVNTLDDVSSTDGFCSLREAITAANLNTSYNDCPGGDSRGTDLILFNVNGIIYLGSPLPSIINAGPVTIDGGEAITINGNATHRIFYLDTDGDLILRNLMVFNGFVGSDGMGAGLYNNGGDLRIENCTFANNTVTGFNSRGGGICHDSGEATINKSTFLYNVANTGGGIYKDQGSLSITDSVFKFNNAEYEGGAIYQLNTKMEVIESEFMGNIAGEGGGIHTSNTAEVYSSTFNLNSAAYQGGGFYAEDAPQVTISNTIFTENSAPGGGAIQLEDSEVTIYNCNFFTNTAVVGGAIDTYVFSKLNVLNSEFYGNEAEKGGAIGETQSLSTMISNSIFRNNTAISGGAIYADEVAGTIWDSEFSDNVVTENGGAIYNSGYPGGLTDLSVINSTLSGNEAGWGGAIYNITGTLRLNNSTFHENKATVIANNLYNRYSSPGILTASNSVVSDSGFGANCFGTITDFGHNIDNQSTCGFSAANDSLSNTDPLIGSLMDNGGEYGTRTHALLAGSPAINQADPILCPVQDQREFNRRDGYCDIGAYEAQPSVLTALGGSGQSTLILTQFPQPLLVDVKDTYGNLLGGVEIIFTGPTSGPGISNSGASGTTESGGMVEFLPAANGIAGGPYTVSATAHRPTIEFSLTNLGYSTTTKILEDAPDPSDTRQAFHVFVDVSSSQGNPGGLVMVTVSDRSEQCSIELSEGRGVCALTIPYPGEYSLTATYLGDDTHQSSSDTEIHAVTGEPIASVNLFLPLIEKK